ncbi:hypothetical protein [Rhodanobacter sp. 115]|uniref:hypothetical protein n=1 Tax=Rhodanobacter sp. FW021-MT20 TaxID=1162282 RepID=UPI0012F7A1E9|nr:hypothetical protein [Rhodanobacter sp. 115]
MVKPQPIAKLEPGDLVTEREAAAQSRRLLSAPCATGAPYENGPHYRKIGTRLVRYHRADLAEFQRIMVGESGEAAA